MNFTAPEPKEESSERPTEGSFPALLVADRAWPHIKGPGRSSERLKAQMTHLKPPQGALHPKGGPVSASHLRAWRGALASCRVNVCVLRNAGLCQTQLRACKLLQSIRRRSNTQAFYYLTYYCKLSNLITHGIIIQDLASLGWDKKTSKAYGA